MPKKSRKVPPPRATQPLPVQPLELPRPGPRPGPEEPVKRGTFGRPKGTSALEMEQRVQTAKMEAAKQAQIAAALVAKPPPPPISREAVLLISTLALGAIGRRCGAPPLEKDVEDVTTALKAVLEKHRVGSRYAEEMTLGGALILATLNMQERGREAREQTRKTRDSGDRRPEGLGEKQPDAGGAPPTLGGWGQDAGH